MNKKPPLEGVSIFDLPEIREEQIRKVDEERRKVERANAIQKIIALSLKAHIKDVS